MPLTGVPSHDIPVERKAGKPEKQAVAIALNKERSMKGKDDYGPYAAEVEAAKKEMLRNKQLWKAGKVPYVNFTHAHKKYSEAIGKARGTHSEDVLPIGKDSVQWEPHEDEPVKPITDMEATPSAPRPKPSRPVMSILNKEDLAKMTAKGGSKLHDVEPIEEGFEHSEHRQRKPQPWEDVRPVGKDAKL